MGDAAWKADFAAQLFKEGGTLSEALANASPQLDALVRRLLQLFGEVMNTEVRPGTKMDARALLCSSSPVLADEMSQMKIAGLCAMKAADSIPVPIQNLQTFISEVGNLPPLKALGHRLRSNALSGPRRGAVKRDPRKGQKKETTEPDTMLPDSVSEQG